MSFFGSSKKTYYNSTSSVLFAESPSVVKQTVGAAITQNRNIASDLITNLTNGAAYRANCLHNWARTGENFPWGLPDGSLEIISPQSQDYVKRVIAQELGIPMSPKDTIVMLYVIVETDPTLDRPVYKAEYQIIKDGNLQSTVHSWSYDPATGVYPLLAIREADIAPVSPYFPIIPIRVNGEYLGESGKDTRGPIVNACRFLNLKPDDLHKGISGDPDNPNPVEDAYVVIAVEVTNDEPVALEYLHRFFSVMYGKQTVHKADLAVWEAKYADSPDEETPLPPHNVLNISDSNFSMELGWLYIEREVKTGNLGPLNSYHKAIDLRGSGNVGRIHNYSKSVLILRKQLDEDEYEELSVHGLVHSNYAIAKLLRTTLDMAKEEEHSPSFYVPLRKDVVRDMGSIKAHDLMNLSIRMVVNDKQVVKLKWYQTGFFQIFLAVVAVVVTIIWPPFGIAAMSAAAVGIAVAQLVLATIFMPMIIKAMEDLLGEELTLLVAVLATAFGYGGGASTGSVISAAMQGIQGAYSISIANQMKDIAKELEVLKEDIKEVEEEIIDQQQDVMMTLNALSGDPYAILEPSKYVARAGLAHKIPTLLAEATAKFADMGRFTDRPDSYIRLGHYGV